MGKNSPAFPSNRRAIMPNGRPRIIARSRIGALVEYPMLVDQGQGHQAKTFEKFVRPPGTRIIAIQNERIYLQQEWRIEHQAQPDWRLPGGKMFDTFAAFEPYMGKKLPSTKIIAAAKRELAEETGLAAKKWSILAYDRCGATVEWDLWYVIAEEVFSLTRRHRHNEGEEIESGKWLTPRQIARFCYSGQINEG